MKRILRYLFVIVICACFSTVFNVNAVEEGTTTMLYNGTYGYTTVSEEITQVTPYMSHILNKGTAISNSGKTTMKNRRTHIYKADIKNSDNLKLVNWIVKKGNEGFSKYGILDIALDYEKNHPGYIVLAGTNADQFYTGFGTGLGTNGSDYFYPQPYYPFIADGNNYFSYSPYANCSSIVGFKNNNDDVQFVYGDRSINGLYIHVYDANDKEIGSFLADDLNIESELGANQTTVLSTQKLTENALADFSKSSNNDFYIIENPELSYVSNSVKWTWKKYNVNAFYGLGTISKINNGSVQLSGTQFAIETTNESLKQALKVGVKVKCQYEFDTAFSRIKEGTGFHTVQIYDGVAQNVANGYNTPNYPRSIFGCDNSGNVYLITTEKSTGPKDGMAAQEINAMMLQYGITYAFQCDGGGSVQSICRNSDGVLEYSQEAYEVGNRPVLTATFIVMKVEEIEATTEEVTVNSARIKLVDKENAYNGLGIKLSCEGYEEIFEANKGVIELSNLKKDTRYTYCVVYKKNDKYEETYIKNSFMTLKNNPTVDSIKLIDNKDGTYSLNIGITDSDEVCLKASVTINGKNYTIQNKNGSSVVNLGSNTYKVLDMTFMFDCQYTESRVNVIIENPEIEQDYNLYLYHVSTLIDDFFSKLLK